MAQLSNHQVSKRARLPVAVVVAALCACCLGCDPSSTSTSSSPVIAPTERIVTPVSTSSEINLPTTDTPTTIEGTPRIEIDEPVHQFGNLTPGEAGKHTFKIRNTGTAPLSLVKIGSSCKCVLTKLAKEGIAPGETTEVELQWVAKHSDESFRQTVTLKTNDPDHGIVELAIIGRVAAFVAISPGTLVFPTIETGESVTGLLRISSGQWKEFAVEVTGCTLDGVECEATSLGVDELITEADHLPLSGWDLSVKLPPLTEKGHVQHQLKLRMTPADPNEKPRDAVIGIEATVVGHLAFYDDGLDENGVLHIGAIDPAETTVRTIMLKQRKSASELQLTDFDVDPDFLDVELETIRYRKGETSLYNLRVTIPAHRVTRPYSGPSAAKLNLQFEPADVGSAHLAIEFAPQR